MDAQRRRQPLDAATLALIKVDIEESDLTLDEMSVKYDRSPSYLSRLSREHGWLMRSERLGRRPRSAPSISLHAREAIAQRIARFVNSKLDYLEKGMQDGTITPEEVERGTKAVATIIGGFDKVAVRPEHPDEDKRTMAQSKDADGSDEVERLQREIIERLERIQRRRDAARGSA